MKIMRQAHLPGVPCVNWIRRLRTYGVFMHPLCTLGAHQLGHISVDLSAHLLGSLP